MGILRTDRVSGLGGANAIKGSVFFSGQGELKGPKDDDFKFTAGGDFTVEAWVNAFHFDANSVIAACWDQTGDTGGDCWLFNISNAGLLRLAWSPETVSDYWITGGTITKDKWHHVALTRSGNTFRIFLDGTQTATGTNSSTNSANSPLQIGKYAAVATSYWYGYISNLRILKGEALYTSAFTPPNRELTVIENTVFLGCQSAGDVTKEETGKTLVVTETGSSNSPGPQASRFTPNSPVGFSTTTDVGTQFGSTFDGVTTFDSQAYFVPPGGNTRERNRGRGLLGGSNDGSPFSNSIQFITIQSQGNSMDFGDLSEARSRDSSYASSTRGIWGGGQTPSETDRIDFVTIATTGNATDFGNLTVSRIFCSGTSSATRGLTVGGYSAPAVVNVIDFTTIASAGDAQDFGDLLGVKAAVGALSSTTRAVFGGGYSVSNPSAPTNDITSLTIATTGNSADFGDLTIARRYLNGVSSNTRGVFGSGSVPAANNTIDFITIASAGDATDFGDATIANEHRAGISNSIRGVNAGSGSPAIGNTIDFITIATTGDAVDFGDTTTNMGYTAGCSDSHGGLE